jgi:hypothetical protein
MQNVSCYAFSVLLGRIILCVKVPGARAFSCPHRISGSEGGETAKSSTRVKCCYKDLQTGRSF